MHTIESLCNSINSRLQIMICERKDFRTNRHIVVFESDDWGSIRMSNKEDWNELLRIGYAVDKRPYERFDTLESAEDLEALFEVLVKHKDCKGNHPVITANMLMVNPDFDSIEKSGFQDYYYEPVTKTYERYFGDTKVLELMKQGKDEGVFMPQSHGREHFNVAQWMKGLQDGDKDLMTAFKLGMCGIAPKAHPEKGNLMMNALKANTEEEQNTIDSVIAEGLTLFEQLWGFRSKSFVAPCYLWNKSAERVLSEGGVKLIQTSRTNKSAYKSPARRFYSGQRNTYDMVYSVRNCSFEPATNERESVVDTLMKQVDYAFAKHKLAVFSTHRINYVGGLSDQNRKRTLNIFDQFLTAMIKKYPNIEFLGSDKLGSVFL